MLSHGCSLTSGALRNGATRLPAGFNRRCAFVVVTALGVVILVVVLGAATLAVVHDDAGKIAARLLQLLSSRYAMYVKRYADVGIDLTKEWIELAPAPHTALGGVCVTPECQSTVKGLFACGEIIGGLHGANRVGGNAGLETLVFGRRAGLSAAAYAARQEAVAPHFSIPVPAGGSIAGQLMQLRRRMQETLWNSAGPTRSGKALSDAMGTLEECLANARALQGASAEETFLRLRLENDLITAWLTIQAAYARDNSLGCHSRTDCPAAEIPPRRITLQKSGAAAVLIQKESVSL